MVYQTDETSIADGQPILLVHFGDSIGNDWRYTTYHDTISYSGYDYVPEVTSVGNISITDRRTSEEITIQLGRGNTLLAEFYARFPEDEVLVTIYRGHNGDYIIRWVGYLVSISVDSDGNSECKCVPKTSSMSRVGRRRKVQRLCDLALFGQGTGMCNVSESSYTVTGTLSTYSGNSITASIFATKSDGWFQAGKLTINNQKRLIRSHTGNTVIVNRPFTNITVGDSVSATAGCLHTPSVCTNKFSNKYNYGGSEHLPVTNPFTQNIEYGVGSNVPTPLGRLWPRIA
jgi:uncharacterized phage protein (TIGR02218 family)